jgi:hypothetical protein
MAAERVFHGGGDDPIFHHTHSRIDFHALDAPEELGVLGMKENKWGRALRISMILIICAALPDSVYVLLYSR